MAAASKIEWTDSTFNPWVGCTKVTRARNRPSACDFVTRRSGPNVAAKCRGAIILDGELPNPIGKHQLPGIAARRNSNRSSGEGTGYFVRLSLMSLTIRSMLLGAETSLTSFVLATN